jgi:hypothetical protein
MLCNHDYIRSYSPILLTTYREDRLAHRFFHCNHARCYLRCTNSFSRDPQSHHPKPKGYSATEVVTIWAEWLTLSSWCLSRGQRCDKSCRSRAALLRISLTALSMTVWNHTSLRMGTWGWKKGAPCAWVSQNLVADPRGSQCQTGIYHQASFLYLPVHLRQYLHSKSFPEEEC